MSEWVKGLEDFIRSGVKANHRRIVVLVGSNDDAVAESAVEVVKLFLNLTNMNNGVYLYQPEYGDARRRLKAFMDGMGSIKFKPMPFKDTKLLLGQTLDYAVVDLFNDLKPNDIGRVGSVVRGGGIYVFLMPPVDKWLRSITKFQLKLITPPHKPEEVRQYLKFRFWESLMKGEGISIYDVDGSSFIKPPQPVNTLEVGQVQLSIPNVKGKATEVYKLAKTQDQVNVISMLEGMINEKGKVNAVIIADRGRGKSAAVGLAVSLIGHRLRRRRGVARIVVTAESPDNAETLMEFARRGFEELGYDVEVSRTGGSIVSLSTRGVYVDYYKPYPLMSLQRPIDLVVVDEAAMMPLPVLYGIHNRFNRVIYSTTIHGYEGAGRGFSVRFLKYLKSRRSIRVLEYEMTEPIRYAKDDPIEKWLFKTFLLDAEPAHVNDDDLKLINEGRVKYIEPNIDELFLKDEETLRQFFGIYVQAHYRNEPDDLGMMMDAPHHTVRALTLENGKVVVSIELAEEGGLDDDTINNMVLGFKPPGNIIPDRMVKYWKIPDFAKLRGWRIVRIATHPELQDKGLGSTALRMLENDARVRGLDWIGVGFGVNAQLLKFWVKNGYLPIHISPERNPVSGEYSVLMIKPISNTAKEAVYYANREFRIRLLSSLSGPYVGLEPDVALMLLTSNEPVAPLQELNLTKGQFNRLVAYAWGPMTYENTVDALIELFKAYFMRISGVGFRIPEIMEKGIIAKVFQSKTWSAAARELGVKPTVLMLGLRAISRVLLVYFYGNSFNIPVFMIQPSKRQKQAY
ncbi:tRNA(Met) cytidine acetyltransferase TmcA [Caldivirga sp.]|uniref:tRNA(Met) cytidine acetyltransferase TmcA n=1 Tax=Caldivirga sp. TaxID=2080243 RepID=UPI003D0CD36D